MYKLKQDTFLIAILNLLPERRYKGIGRRPIPNSILIPIILDFLWNGLRWKDINHSITCWNYLHELQRRGLFKKILNLINRKTTKFKSKKVSIDCSELESFNLNKECSFSGKSWNYCTKLTLEVDQDYIPLSILFNKGSAPDTRELDKLISKKKKLPVEMHLDKGFENYERRRKLKIQGCQVRMEQKIYKNNRKRGDKFHCSEEEKGQRLRDTLHGYRTLEQ